MTRRLPLLCAAAFLAAPRADARACSFAGPGPYVVDASMQATDHGAPTLGTITVARLRRGAKTGGCMEGNSCDGIGSLTLAGAASDDVTPATDIGYRFSLVAGALPPSFSILLGQPSTVVVSDGDLWFSWDDGTEDHAPIDFTLQLVAIDRAGNQSAPQTVHVTDDPGGCAIARPRPHARGLVWALAAVMLLAARRRRRHA
jgi:MYXO-CTERM domain-containing protein